MNTSMRSTSMMSSNMSSPNATSFEFYTMKVNGRQTMFFKRSEKYGSYYYQMMIRSEEGQDMITMVVSKLELNTVGSELQIRPIKDYAVRISKESMPQMIHLPSIYQLFKELESKNRSLLPSKKHKVEKKKSLTKKHKVEKKKSMSKKHKVDKKKTMSKKHKVDKKKKRM
jgi:hypothetical protein